MTVKVYDSKRSDELWEKLYKGEKLTEEEEEYLTYCYHWEEAQAGLL